MLETTFACISAIFGLLCVGGCSSEALTEGIVMVDDIRKDLASEPEGSDAAVILSRAINEAQTVPQERQSTIFGAARKRAEQARRFEISSEAALPEGWPKPSLPGLIRTKTYPSVRSAWVSPWRR